jgi:diguanylate cyclase (GGDEF)-like protein/PAS domain S-box-containing protein
MLRELPEVLRAPLLRNVLLAALAAATIFPLYIQFYSYPHFTELLLRFTEDDAARVAHHLSASLSRQGGALSRATLPPSFGADVRQVQIDFHLEKLKVFAPDGEVIFSTDPAEIGTLNTSDYFHRQVAGGLAYSKTVRKAALTAEGRQATADVVESYVPLLHADRFIGAFEIYFDITARRASLDSLLSKSASITYGVAGLLFIAVLVTLTVAARAERTRANALTALRQSEERLHNMAASAQDAIVGMDVQGRIAFWNHAAERIFGFSAAEALGQDLHRLIAPPHYHDAVANGFPRFHATGEGPLLGRTTELVGRRKDGTEIPVEISIAAIQDGNGRNAIGIIRDIRERKETEQRLKLGTRVIAHAAQGIIVTDPQCNIQLVNPAFTQLTGYTPEEAVGNTPKLLKSGRHDAGFYRNLWQELQTTGRWQGEIWNRRKSGEIYPEWLSMSAIHDAQGKVANYIGMFSDISQLKEVEQGLERLAFYDPLTDIPNRVLFRERLQQALKETDRTGRRDRTALLYLDLDYFKQVNDTHGHAVGDRLLQEAAARLGGLVREIDTVARLGGDEFAVVLGRLPDPAVATRIADKIVATLTRPFHLGEGHADIRIGTSIGIALYPDHANDLSSLIKLADAAMYAAKAAGRNRYRLWAPDPSTTN